MYSMFFPGVWRMGWVGPHGRDRRSWEDNIRMDITEIDGKAWNGYIWLRIGPVAGPYEHGKEHSGSIKGGEILEYLSGY
jgi:hypothetical protein